MLRDKTRNSVIFTDQGLTIEKSFGLGKSAFIASADIAAFRFGVRELKGFRYTFGRQYFIELKDFKHNLYRIKFSSFYGIKNKEYYRVWADLLQDIWDYYLANQLNYYSEMFNIQQVFDLAGVTFHADGISWNKQQKVTWDKVGLKSCQSHFMIHHTDNPDQFKCCVFSIDWNAVVLQSLLKDIIREHARVKRGIRRGF